MQRHDRPTTRGFTILEMLIAMTITIIMLGVISRIFFDTTNTIGQGTALSQIIASSRAGSDQFDRDALAIAGADEGGFIVIVNKIIADINPNPNRHVPMKSREGGETNRPVRADQLVFIRKIDEIEPLTPGTTQSFAPGDPIALQAPFARVWYGHVRRTQPNGTDLDNRHDPTDLGDLDNLGVNFASNPNRVGTNWILGRQALMLSENPASNGVNIKVDEASYDENVDGLGNIPPQKRLYMGLTDVCNQSLSQINTALNTAALGGNPAYQNQAYRYTFITKRLRANPTPSGRTFDSWQIGQMHPVFMENVSDFVVEFAADVTDDPAIPNFPDGEPDTNPTTGNVEWYGLGHPPDWGSRYTFDPNDPINANEIRFTFRHDYGDNWPYMIRIRYRLHDSNGRFEENIGDSARWQEQGYGPQSGQWFEQIFRVRQP